MIGGFWAAILLGTTGASFIIGNAMNTHIRKNHSETWDQLGRPTFWNNSPANSIKAGKFFIFGEEYKRLNDEILNRYVFIARIMTGLVSLILFAGVILVALGKLGSE